MTIRDITNGPKWILWGVGILCILMSALLLSGRGAWLIAGYNTSPKEKKSRYDEKKLCRVSGGGMAVISIFVFIMALWDEVLPAGFMYVFLGITLLVTIIMLILMNTYCRKH